MKKNKAMMLSMGLLMGSAAFGQTPVLAMENEVEAVPAEQALFDREITIKNGITVPTGKYTLKNSPLLTKVFMEPTASAESQAFQKDLLTIVFAEGYTGSWKADSAEGNLIGLYSQSVNPPKNVEGCHGAPVISMPKLAEVNEKVEISIKNKQVIKTGILPIVMEMPMTAGNVLIDGKCAGVVVAGSFTLPAFKEAGTHTIQVENLAGIKSAEYTLKVLALEEEKPAAPVEPEAPEGSDTDNVPEAGGPSVETPGWHETEQGLIHVKEDGTFAEGWEQLEKDGIVSWFYFGDDKTAAIDWLKLEWGGESRWYHFDEEGRMSTSKWIENNGIDCYVDSSGSMRTSQWLNFDGTWYYVDGSGIAVKNRWLTYKGASYYMNEEGIMEASKWISDASGRKSYVDNSGAAVTNRWVTLDGKSYYFDKNGYLAVNTIVEDKYKVDANGVWDGKTLA